LEVVNTYNKVLYSDYIRPARLRLNLPEVAPELKRIWHPCSTDSAGLVVNIEKKKFSFLVW